jgi:hypothetical protein
MAKMRKVDVRYWTLVEPVWLPLNRTWDNGCEEFLRVFQAIRPEVRDLYAAHWCQSEVCNGGFHQFFSNTTGLLAPEALEGFRAIGLKEWAEILAEAIKFFGSPYPREQADRQDLLARGPGRRRDEWDPFCELDKQFYEWTDRWEDAADSYAARVSPH